MFGLTTRRRLRAAQHEVLSLNMKLRRTAEQELREEIDAHITTIRALRTAEDSLGREQRMNRILDAHLLSTERQTPDRQSRYAVRSGVEGTNNEFAHGHGMRRCRCRGQPKAHLQHVFTAIAVDIERLSGLPPTGETPLSRPPTAFQDYLDQHGIPA